MRLIVQRTDNVKSTSEIAMFRHKYVNREIGAGIVVGYSCGRDTEFIQSHTVNDISICANCDICEQKPILVNYEVKYDHCYRVVLYSVDCKSDSSLHCCKKEFDIKFDEKTKLVVNQTNFYEFIYDFHNNKVLITLNGKCIKVSDKNIKRALSNISSGFNNSIYECIERTYRYGTLHKSVAKLINNRWLEVLYNTYGNLLLVKHFDSVNVDGTSPSKILNIPKNVVRFCVDKIETMGNNFSEVVPIVINLYSDNKDRPDFVINVINNACRGLIYASDIRKYVNLVSIHHYDNYRLNRYINYDCYTYQGILPKEAINTLFDYINICCELGIDYERYPSSLKKAHDVVAMNRDYTYSKKVVDDFNSAINSEEYCKYQYHGDLFSVIKPTCIEDVLDEARALHHCVDSYIGKISRGDCKIYFVRKVGSLDKSLLTLEIIDNSITQCSGLCNRCMTEKEFDFLREFSKKLGVNMRVSLYNRRIRYE